MQKTPQANRLHIAVFGRRNVGKSSLINALTNQSLAVVSDVAGTTTDPVYKSMELLPIGPVVMIDTAGIDDTGSLGDLRVKKTMEVMRKTDLALLVIDNQSGFDEFEKDIYNKLEERETPVIIVINKTDIYGQELKDLMEEVEKETGSKPALVSAAEKKGIDTLRGKIAENAPIDYEEPYIIGDLIEPYDTVVLVVPIDSAAPKGRLILPQVQTLRDILDHNGISAVVKETELAEALDKFSEKPKMVVTDSQAFGEVDQIVPDDIMLTSFSVLFARYKGDLEIFIEGAKKLEQLTANDKVLIAESCTHRRTQDDIGTIKIPGWLREKVGEGLVIDHVAGREYPDNIEEYDLIFHCGGCMLNRREILYRLKKAKSEGVPVINYGMAIAQLHGILDRALQPFPKIYSQWMEK